MRSMTFARKKRPWTVEKTTVRGERGACKSIECKPPFAWKKAEDMEACCSLCWADSVKTPDDRSFANSLTAGAGVNNNADPIL